MAREPEECELNGRVPELKASDLQALTEGKFNDQLTKRLRARASVCRLEYPAGNPIGTGFLVGEDIIITCWHVLDQVENPAQFIARFDFRTDEKFQIERTTEYRILVDWTDLPSSRASAKDDITDLYQDPDVTELDYCILRLDGYPWKDPILAGDGQTIRRGWIDLPNPGLIPHKFATLTVLHHPMGQSLVESSREFSIFHITQSGTRIRHITPTLPASSGAPCFNVDFSLIALHHRGSDQGDGISWNSAIPIHLISEDLRKKKFALEPFTDQDDGIAIRWPRKIDFRPYESPTTDTDRWKDSDLIVSLLDIDVGIEGNGLQNVTLNEIELKFIDFPRARNFRWTWFADISESGKGWLGQLGDSRPVKIARGEKVKFTAQFIPTADFNRMSWRNFHDFCHDTKRNVLEISLVYNFSSAILQHSLFVSVETLAQIFEVYDKNDLSYTRNAQPRTLDVQK